MLSAFFGILGAYLGGLVDEAFSLFSNVMLVIPGLPLVIVISGFVPPESRGLWTIALVLALTSWAGSARVLRAQTLSLRNRDYVAAARVAGERAWRVIGVEILPNLLPMLASQFVFAVISAILGEAGLSFLGLGASNSSTLGHHALLRPERLRAAAGRLVVVRPAGAHASRCSDAGSR